MDAFHLFALPLSRGIVVRSLVAGASFADVAPLLWSELGIGLMYGVIGYLVFSWFEVQAKRCGTLEVF